MDRLAKAAVATPPDSRELGRRRAMARRTALCVAALAVLVYASFMAMAVSRAKAGHGQAPQGRAVPVLPR